MQVHHFNVFGRIAQVQREAAVWRVYWISPDGKRVPANFVVPDFIEPDEMAQHLFDLFHESASPESGDVIHLNRSGLRSGFDWQKTR